MADQTAIRDQEFVAGELNRCNRCGYCMQSCPTYRAMRREVSVARGRNEIIRRAQEDEQDLAADTLDPLFECLLCGACTNDCFGKVQTAELIVRAREAFHAAHGQPAVQRYLFREVLPHPERLDRLVRLLRLSKRTYASDIARRLGLLRWISPMLDAADSLVTRMPRRFLRDRLSAIGFAPTRSGAGPLWRLEPARATGLKVAYFIGCGTNFQQPDSGEAAMRLLAHAGCQVTVLPNSCCGLPPWSYGDFEAARGLARANVELLGTGDFDLIVTECGSCSGFLKRYPELLGDDERAVQDLSSRVRDFTEALSEFALPAPARIGGTVTYHDPCHLGRGQGIIEPPRKLLVDAAGMELVELPEASWCCGAAGSYNITHPEMSRDILQRKLARVGETGADALASACPACIIQLACGTRREGSRRPVRHVAELIAERQGLME